MKIRVLIGAWLLFFISGAVHALGLGEILVNSRLNQPLNAEITVREATPGEAEQLVAKLASQDDFTRVGLERARVPVTLRFETAKNARGQTIIKVTSDEPVREPFLTLLVEANWSGGRLLREYGILLDPPVSAPASTIARTPTPAPTAPVVAAPSRPAAAEPSSTPAPAPAPQTAPSPAPAAPVAAPTPARPVPAPESRPPTGFAATPSSAPAPAPAPAAVATTDGEYTVQRGDTLSGIARTAAADAGVTVNQMMLALQRENPKAFFADNINALKAGVVLRIPDADVAREMSNNEATTEVRRQIGSWTGAAAPSAPVLADAGAAPSTTIRPAGSDQPAARLELVPPSANEDGGEAGSNQGGSDVAGIQSELQRTREELRSRDDEVSELSSRVRDLEDLNTKNARLLELKNAEVAELQRRLADAGEQVPAAPAASAVEPPAAPASAESSDEVVATTEVPSPDEVTPVTTAGETSPAQTDVIASVGNDTPAESSTSTASEPADGATQDPTDVAAADAGEMSEAEWAAAAAGGESDPFEADNPAAAPSSADTWTPGEPESNDAAPASAAPVQGTAQAPAASVAAAPAVAPSTSTTPWYSQPLLLGAGLLGLALLLLLVLLARRQRARATAKADDTASKRSVSELFSDAPTATGIGAAATAAALSTPEDEDAALLRRQIDSDPDDFGAYLELLSIHYANRDRASFETWAERFYDRPSAEGSAEWAQVVAMGEELLPAHPLFDAASDENVSPFDEPIPAISDDWASPAPVTAPIEDVRDPVVPASDEPVWKPESEAIDVPETRFDFEADEFESVEEGERAIEFTLDDVTPPASSAPAPVQTRHDDEDVRDSDALPVLDFATNDDRVNAQDHNRLEAEVATEEEFGSGLDDAATKLELARAYLDMGDPEGARAMLEEVLGEGDTSQREEARKLLATL